MNQFSFTKKTGARIVATLSLLSMVLGLVPTQAQAQVIENAPFSMTEPDWSNLPNDLLSQILGLSGDVGICHATQGANPYASGNHTISKHAVFQQGHYGHNDGGLDDLGDIIQPFTVTFFGVFNFPVPGKNWSHVFSNGQTGQQIWNADCVPTTPVVDTDSDTIPDATDNCPSISNSNQLDTDGDHVGNACDTTPNGDTDGDGIDNNTDNCPAIANQDQADADNDHVGDACDTPTEPTVCENTAAQNYGQTGSCVFYKSACISETNLLANASFEDPVVSGTWQILPFLVFQVG